MYTTTALKAITQQEFQKNISNSGNTVGLNAEGAYLAGDPCL